MNKKNIIFLLFTTMIITAVPVLAIKPAGPSAKNGLVKVQTTTYTSTKKISLTKNGQ